MSSKRPSPKSGSTTDEWKITDEWGIYDPEKAGIPALFARLGRPILRGAPTSSRKERRRAQRPERSTEGVGLALAEARRRAEGGASNAGNVQDDAALPLAAGNPTRAMRLALRAQAAVNAMGTPAAEPFVPQAAPPQPEQQPDAPPVVAASPADAPVARKRGVKRAAPSRPAASPAQQATAAPAESPVPASKGRTRKTTAKTRTRQTAAPVADVASDQPVAALAPAPKPQGPPEPSPRRPRGPVPLAAWAHAPAEPPKVEPRRADKRGFWRGIFRIPTEVALVEYAHGAKIHRLLIEAGDDQVSDFI